ncbi:MAG: metallophosphoesterase [Myxococcota bacterium]
MTIRMMVFFVVMPILWIALHYYMGRRIVTGSALPRAWSRVAWGLVAILALLPPATFLAMRGGGMDGLESIQWLGYLMMGISSIVLVLLLTVELLRGGRRLVLRFRKAPPPEPDPSRRAFLGRAVNIGIAGGAGTVAGVGVIQARQIPEVVEVDVPIKGLPPEAEGFRIVQISDVHIGPTIHGDFLSAVVDRVNGLEPDVIAVTGDLIDGWVDQLRDEMVSLERLRARHGAFFVTGNHEYYWNGPQWCDHVASLGLTVLNNAHQVIEHDGARLVLAGVTDISAGGMVPSHASSPATAIEGAPDDCPKVLLAHQPRSINAAAEAGFDLQISGHTHGGQYFPMNLLVYLAQPYVAGLHQHNDKTSIYVSRGTGYWGPPVRLGAPHEITLLRLVAA